MKPLSPNPNHPLTPKEGIKWLEQEARERSKRAPLLQQVVDTLFVPSQDFASTIREMKKLGASPIEVDKQLRLTKLTDVKTIKEMVYRYYYEAA